MPMNRAWIAILPLFCGLAIAQQSVEEQAVWKLEHAYWEDVKLLDLRNYRELWHPNFVGWPSISLRPVRKDHITDWITENTSKGLHLESYSLRPAAIQGTENLVVDHYWLTMIWSDRDHRGNPNTIRITHTWIRVGKGWQIIGGMSAPEPNAPE
jgi:uncharacterized protein DUF4440